jgi:ABC-type transporter Mla subunit MlaD
MKLSDVTDKLKKHPEIIVAVLGGGVVLYFLVKPKTMNTAAEYSQGIPTANGLSENEDSAVQDIKEQFTNTINAQGTVIANLLNQTNAMSEELESNRSDIKSVFNSLTNLFSSAQKSNDSVLAGVQQTVNTQRSRESYLDESRSLANALKNIDKSTDAGYRNYVQTSNRLKTVQNEANNAGVSRLDLARTELPTMTPSQIRAGQEMDDSESVSVPKLATFNLNISSSLKDKIKSMTSVRRK